MDANIAQGPGYTGHVADAASGLIYMQQRYYDPVLGRLLSTDPVGELGINFNRYAYVGNNPYSAVDPDGRVVESVNPKMNDKFAQYINSLATGTFRVYKENKLELVSKSGNQSKKSEYDAKRQIETIDSPNTIAVEIVDPSAIEQEVKDVYTDAGGGAILSTSSGAQAVGVLDSKNLRLKDVDGKAIRDDPADILAHIWTQTFPQLFLLCFRCFLSDASSFERSRASRNKRGARKRPLRDAQCSKSFRAAMRLVRFGFSSRFLFA